VNNPIDWELGKKLAGNNRDVAKELLTLLAKGLPDDIDHIKKSCRKEDYKTLFNQAHKLHGALCYCGAPHLKSMVGELETALKQGKLADIPTLVTAIEKAAQELIRAVALLPD